MVLDAGKEQAQGAEESGKGRYQDLADMQLAGQTGSVDRTCAAKGHQCEIPWVASALG